MPFMPMGRDLSFALSEAPGLGTGGAIGAGNADGGADPNGALPGGSSDGGMAGI